MHGQILWRIQLPSLSLPHPSTHLERPILAFHLKNKACTTYFAQNASSSITLPARKSLRPDLLDQLVYRIRQFVSGDLLARMPR